MADYVYVYENHGRGSRAVFGVDSATPKLGALAACVARVESKRGAWVSLAGDSQFAHKGMPIRLTPVLAAALDNAARTGLTFRHAPRMARALAESIRMGNALRAGLDPHAPAPALGSESPILPELAGLGAALDAAYPPVTAPAQDAAPNVSICEALIAIRDWGKTMRAEHFAHYGIERLISGADAVLMHPSSLDLGAPISPYIPS